jgi:hypothetical protein
MAPQTLPLAVVPDGPLAGVECRVWERHSCDMQTACQPLASKGGGDLIWGGTIRDISANGIGLILNRRFEPDTRLVINLPFPASGTRRSILVRVVHATPLTPGFWLLGCVFPRPLPEDELFALLGRAGSAREEGPQDSATVDYLTAAFAPAGGTPTPCPGQEVLLRRVRFETTTAQGASVHVLADRVYLRASWPLAAGTPLKVWVGRRRRGKPFSRMVVLSCCQQGGLWVVSYAFERTPSAEVLDSLGHPPA